MLRARRAAHVFFRLSEELLPDIGELLRGTVQFVPQTRLLGLSLLTGREQAISGDELRFLQKLPVDGWTAVADLPVDPDVLRRLALDGFVVCDEETGELAELRRRDDRLANAGWSPFAALYHSQSRWRDVDSSRHVETSGPPQGLPKAPPAFSVAPDSLETIELPLSTREDGLFRLLSERRTTRSFEPAVPLTQEELSLVLYYTFGCHGFARLRDDVVLLRKTSPSGGSLHPIEVHALVVRVQEVPAGLYHYRADRHALELVQPLQSDGARERLIEFVAGQTYLASAPVLLIMTARFARSFWKYRSSARAYSVVLMDAAHLSQTLYLVCTELGLGAFVSAAVNDGNVRDALGLELFEEDVLAVCGFGPPARSGGEVDVEFSAYVPRETEI